MAAFDLNGLYFLKNAAPKAASFEELNAPTERGFNLGRAYNENYNRNSLQNLIAQREKEGVPYDRLSNEAAKWDLGAAQAMRNERRSSLEYNYKQSVAEFEQWRRNMARRICGLILQKADELGIAPEELDRVLNVAASYVVTYDEALAQWLLGQAMARRNAITRANKPAATPSYKNLWSKAQDAKREAETYDRKLNSAKYWGLVNYALAAEAVAEREARKGVPAEYNDVLRLLSNFKNRDKEISPDSFREYALSDNFRLINEGGDIQENADFSNIIVPSENGADNGGYASKGDSNAKPKNPVQGVTPEENGTMKIESMLSGVGGFPYIDSKKLGVYIDYADGINSNKDAIKFLEDVKLQLTQDSNNANKGAGKTEGTDKNFFDLVNKKIEERKELEKGGISPKSAKILKLDGKTAAEASAARSEWSRISNLPDLYYVNPGAILPAMQRALLPEERTTDADVARSVLSGAGIDNNIVDKIVNAYASSNGGTFANLMKDKSYATAARALAPHVMNVMVNKYRTLVEQAGNEQDVDEALKETYNISNEVLQYLKGNKILYTEKDLYEKEGDRRQKARSKKERETYQNEMGTPSSTGETLAEKIARRRAEREGVK